MAGGQEQVLGAASAASRRRKKITRAMELIAASQIVRAQGRIAGRRPLPERHRRRPGRGGRRRRGQRRPGPRCPRVTRARPGPGHRGRPRPVRRLQRQRAAPRRATGADERGQPASSTALVSVGRKAQSFFRFRQHRGGDVVLRFLRPPHLRGRPAIAAAITPPFLAEEVDQVLVVSTRFLSAGTQVVETRQLLPLPEPTAEDERGRATRARGLHRVRARVPRPARGARAPLRRGGRLRRAARGVRPASTPPGSGPWRRPPTTPTSW